MRVTLRYAFLQLSIVLSGMVLLTACGTDEGPAVPPKTVTVSGSVQYEDREYDSGGFTGNTTMKPSRFVIVDLVNMTGGVVDTGLTDDEGNYYLEGSGSGMYVRVLSHASGGSGSEIIIHNYRGSEFAITKSLGDEEGDLTADFTISLANDIAGVFNMLDVFASASMFLSEMSSAPLPKFDAYWQTASSQYGTYFCPSRYISSSCPQGKGVYILGGTGSGGDTDEYDDDVLLHEYAHYIESAVGAKDSPGGSHYLTDNDHDLRLAWSEGFGGFFPNALKTWLADNDPERLSTAQGMPSGMFIDTYGDRASISINMANPSPWYCPGSDDCFVFSSGEVSVAGVLAGVQEEFGIEAIWNVLSNYMGSGTSHPATLETFWDGWLQQRAPAEAELEKLQTVFGLRQVNYLEDSFEDDNSRATARNLTVCDNSTCAAEEHFLYSDSSGNDVDMFSIVATAGQGYFVETLDLGNGADTRLRILDANGNLATDGAGNALVNDDRPGTTYCYTWDSPCRIHHDDLMLSSSIDFTPPWSGTWYIEVTTSPNRPVGAGRYGTYSVRVSETSQ